MMPKYKRGKKRVRKAFIEVEYKYVDSLEAREGLNRAFDILFDMILKKKRAKQVDK